METKEYFEKVMQDYNQYRKGRSLRRYCKDEGIDYDWLIEYKKNYPGKSAEPAAITSSFISLDVDEGNHSSDKWRVAQLILESPTGATLELKCSDLFIVVELLNKMA
jgi:hypothetical protein